MDKMWYPEVKMSKQEQRRTVFSVTCMCKWALQIYFISLIDFMEESYQANMGKAIFTLSLSVK